MASRSLLISLLVFCVMAVAVLAGDVATAGGSGGWNLGVTMNPIYINRGDSVKFNYSPDEHNVCQVYSEQDYDRCNVNADSTKYYSGADTVTLSNAGTFWFICSVEGHCNDGMKVTVYVQ